MKFEDLDVWKKSAHLSAELYKKLLDCKDYGFRDQITRSGLSVPSNISEVVNDLLPKSAFSFWAMPRAHAVS